KRCRLVWSPSLAPASARTSPTRRGRWGSRCGGSTAAPIRRRYFLALPASGKLSGAGPSFCQFFNYLLEPVLVPVPGFGDHDAVALAKLACVKLPRKQCVVIHAERLISGRLDFRHDLGGQIFRPLHL